MESDAIDVAGGGQPLAAVGVVLAGGQSQRMGTSKAALLINGVPLLLRVVRRVQQALPQTFVVGSPEVQALVPGVRVIADQRPGLGPLAGLETALAALEREPDLGAPRAFVVACDMPFVAPTLVRALVALAEDAAADIDATVPRSALGLEPLHSVYARGCLPIITQQLDSGHRSLHGLLALLRVHEVPLAEFTPYDPDGLSTFNANAPDEWERALALAERAPER